MKVLRKIAESTLDIKFNDKGYANKAGVMFRLNNNGVIIVSNSKYTNVFGIYTPKTGQAAMKMVANRVHSIDSIAQFVKEQMNNMNMKPYGNWFITANNVITHVENNKGEVWRAVFNDVSRTNPTIKLVKKEDVKKAIPGLRKTKKKEELTQASPSTTVDYTKENNKISRIQDYVTNYRTTYSGLKDIKFSYNEHKLDHLYISEARLKNTVELVASMVKIARDLNGNTYKTTAVEEAEAIIKKIRK